MKKHIAVRYVAAKFENDNFEWDHKGFYEPDISKYETGITGNEFLHKAASREDYFAKHNIPVLTGEDFWKIFRRKK